MAKQTGQDLLKSLPKTPSNDDSWRGGYKYFTEEEMMCKGRFYGACNCDGLPKHSFMMKIERLRHRVGSLPVNSGYRCPSYNRSIRGGPAHPAGLAADFGIYGQKALEVVWWGHRYGLNGIGLKQHGDSTTRFVHVDCLEDSPSAPRPWIWTY